MENRLERLQANEAEWQAILQLLGINNLVPLLHHKLNTFGLHGKLPLSIREGLSESFTANRIKNFIWKKELTALIESMSQAGIALVILKGAVSLFRQHYSHPSCRAMNDMDILLLPEDRAAARTIVGSLGYRHVKSDLREDLFLHPAKRVLIEIHYHLFDAFLSTEEEKRLNRAFWERKWLFEETGLSNVFTLFPEDQLFFHVYHAFVHHLSWIYESLGMFVDFIALYRFHQDAVLSESLLRTACQVHLEPFFLSFLYILEKKTGWRIPGMCLPVSERLGRSLDSYLRLEAIQPGRHVFQKRWLITRGFDEKPVMRLKRICQLLKQDLLHRLPALLHQKLFRV